jgi:rare lipoprotein A
MLRNGTAMVDVRTIDPSEPPPVITASNRVPAPAAPNAAAASAPVSGAATPADSSPAAAGSALFVQAGAFSDPANAERLVEKLRGHSYGKVFVREDQIAGRRMYRVRIGPVPDVAEFDRIVAALERTGINDAHLALD